MTPRVAWTANDTERNGFSPGPLSATDGMVADPRKARKGKQHRANALLMRKEDRL